MGFIKSSFGRTSGNFAGTLYVVLLGDIFRTQSNT